MGCGIEQPRGCHGNCPEWPSALIGTKPGKSATVSATRKGGLDKDKRIKAGKFKPGRSSPEGDTTVKKKPFTYG